MDEPIIDSEQRITQQELLERLYSKNSFIDKIFEEELERRRKNSKDVDAFDFLLALNDTK
jgi:hypothetical protein